MDTMKDIFIDLIDDKLPLLSSFYHPQDIKYHRPQPRATASTNNENNDNNEEKDDHDNDGVNNDGNNNDDHDNDGINNDDHDNDGVNNDDHNDNGGHDNNGNNNDGDNNNGNNNEHEADNVEQDNDGDDDLDVDDDEEEDTPESFLLNLGVYHAQYKNGTFKTGMSRNVHRPTDYHTGLPICCPIVQQGKIGQANPKHSSQCHK